MNGTFRTYTTAAGERRFLCRIYRRDGKQFGATGKTRQEAEQKATIKAFRAPQPHDYSTSRTSG